MKCRIVQLSNGKFQTQTKTLFGWRALQVRPILSDRWVDNEYPTLEKAQEALERYKASAQPPKVVYEEEV